MTLALTVLLSAAWAWVLLDRTAGWLPWLKVVIAVAAVVAAALILAAAGPPAAGDTTRPGHGGTVLAVLPVSALPVSLAVVAGLAGPLAYSIDTAATVHGGASPTAGPAVTTVAAGGLAARRGAGGAGLGGRAGEFGRRAEAPGGLGAGSLAGAGGTTAADPALSKLLETGAGGYRWAAAVVGSDSAASLELAAAGVPVMALGGFSGGDPVPTLAAFQQLVAAHQVHYFVAGGTAARLRVEEVSNSVPVTGPAAGPEPASGPRGPSRPAGTGRSWRAGAFPTTRCRSPRGWRATSRRTG